MTNGVSPTIGITGIGTALPRSVAQAHITAMAERLSCDSDAKRAWLRRVFGRAGVSARGSVLERAHATEPADTLHGFYRDRTDESDGGPSTAERMARYAEEAPELAEHAARDALADAQIQADRVTHLITVSCTGFFAPGIDVAMIQRLALRADVRRLHVGFMGCHAAFNAIEAARSIVAADAGAVVLVVCVELCSLHYAYGWTPDKVVANSLFADGSAAVVVRQLTDRDTSAWRIHGTASRLLPDSRDAMTWTIGDHGFEMTLSPDVPALVGRHVRGWCGEWIGSLGHALSTVRLWAVHPGGPKVLTATEEAIGLPGDALRFSRDVLAQHGNMSSTTVLFILQRMTAERATGLCAALGFGPGLMMEGMLLERFAERSASPA
ncbi:MAG: type III polyketide synthase [Tepidisphaeraceae bacterium]